jgi:hypothetical protein
MDDQHETAHNPKLDDRPGSNTVKDPQDWVSGDEPMTGAQASYLKTLSEEAGEADAYADDLTKAEASLRIDRLKETLGR